MGSAAELLMYAVGDVAIHRQRPETAFAKVAPTLRQADIVFGNFESPISDEVASAHSMVLPLSVKSTSLPPIVDAGFNVLCVANNHMMDFGVKAMEQTLRLLDENGIAHMGAGLNLAQARRPAFVERKGTRIAFLAYNSFYPLAPSMMILLAAGESRPGVAPIFTHPELEPPNVYRRDLLAMQEDVARAKEEADLVMVSCHWGLAWIYELAASQKAIGHAAVDAGADIVLGHHPHILQGIEIYRGKPICYSLSEFCFEIPMDLALEPQSILLKLEIAEKAIRRVSFLPVLMDAERTPEIRGLADPEGRKIAELMGGLCEELGTKVAFEGDEVVVF